MTTNEDHGLDIASSRRFAFGDNWWRFLELLDDERIRLAEESLRLNLGVEDLVGRTFLDIGSGSGLFSLAARRLGATVVSFDFDPQSVACTQELKRRYFADDDRWRVMRGSVLDEGYLRALGEFDVVYSWGVLHHTGSMWQALENAGIPLKSGGKLFIAIYNHQKPWTSLWTAIKKIYNKLPRLLRLPYTVIVITPLEVRALAFALLQGNPARFFRRWTEYGQSARGMNRWRDIVDWVGGYPFETAKPEEIFYFYGKRGLTLRRLFTCGGGHGCNEFVFESHEPGQRQPELILGRNAQ